MNPLVNLAALGDSSDAVARTLLDKGIRGTKSTQHSCPIANYLTSCGFHSVMVGMTFARVQMEDVVVDPTTFHGEQFGEDLPFGAREYDGLEHKLRFVLPPPVRQFIDRFDSGQFPELSDV